MISVVEKFLGNVQLTFYKSKFQEELLPGSINSVSELWYWNVNQEYTWNYTCFASPWPLSASSYIEFQECSTCTKWDVMVICTFPTAHMLQATSEACTNIVVLPVYQSLP